MVPPGARCWRSSNVRRNVIALLGIIVIGGSLSGGLMAQTAPAARLGVVDQDRILNESDEGKRLRTDLEKMREGKATQLETIEGELKDLQTQLLNAQLSLSNEKRAEISRQLKRKRVEYERLNDDAAEEFQEAANRAQGRLVRMFRELIKQYGAEKGYTAIFEANTLYFAADTIDITNDLLTRFNAYTKNVGGP